MRISVNSTECIYKLRAGPAAITFLLRGRPALACDAYCVNHCSPVMKCGFLIDFCIGCDGGTIAYYKNSSRREMRC